MYFLDLLGTFAFAATGAYKAKGAKLHIFGVIFLGIITAVGGGTFRDLVIGRIPLFYFKNPDYLIVAILAGIIIYIAPTFFKQRYSFFRFMDSLGLATFVIIGTSISFEYLFKGSSISIVSFLSSIFLGMLTGFGGGVVRDAIMGDTPVSLQHGSNYLFSAFVGSASFYFLMFYNINLAMAVSMALTLFFREFISGFGMYNKLIKNKRSNSALNSVARLK
jgi:uncharacterized membrane protein YeiH